MAATGHAGRSGGETALVALAESGDVARSVGRPGHLARRLEVLRHDAPRVATTGIPGLRCDVLAQRLGGPTAIDDAPNGLVEQLATVSFPASADLVVLSMSAALSSTVHRHPSGTLFQADPDSDAVVAAWLAEHCEPVSLDAVACRTALDEVVGAVLSSGTELLFYNVSTYVPGSAIRWVEPNEPEAPGLTAQRVNVLLETLDPALGVAVVDVDRLSAEVGAASVVDGPGSYREEFCAGALSEEALRVMCKLPGLSRRFSPDTMRLELPQYDRRTKKGVLEAWHVAAPTAIGDGDPLFDVCFERLRSRLGGRETLDTGRSLRMTVYAGRSGYFRAAAVDVGDSLEVGGTVGIVTDAPDTGPAEPADDAAFPTTVRLLGR